MGKQKNNNTTGHGSRLSSVRRVLFADNSFRLMGNPSRVGYMLPIWLTMSYLIFSVFLYVFGPFNWVTYKPVLFYGLLGAYMVALWFGYRVGLMRSFPKAMNWTDDKTDVILCVISPLVVLSLIIYVINMFRNYGLTTFDFAELGRQMWRGIQNPGLGYTLHQQLMHSIQRSDIIGGYAFTMVNFLWAFFDYPIRIMAMLYFKRLKLYAKIITVLHLIITILHYLSIGTTIEILHVFFLIELPIIIESLSFLRKHELNRKRVLKLVITMLLGMILIFSYFTYMLISRGGINRFDQPDYNIGGIGIGSQETDPPAVTDPPVVEPTTPPTEQNPGFTVPPVLMKFWVGFSSYLTQGYYGMSLALTVPWTPMYGLGNSLYVVDFITDNIYDINQYTYQAKLEPLGWDARVRWHSMYMWLANDVSFFGVIIVMLLIGYLFGAMYKDAISSKNPFAKVSIFYFMLMLLFIPCNNQLAQRPNMMFSFALIILCWILTKHPIRLKHKA